MGLTCSSLSRLSAGAFTLLSALAACEGDSHLRKVPLRTGTDPKVASSCEGRSDGTRCPDDRHCIAQKCVANVCGDGIRAGVELCDDGNLQSGDGCTPSCIPEYQNCPDGTLARMGSSCDGAAGGESDAGNGAACPKIVSAQSSRRTMMVTEVAELSALVSGYGVFQWYVTEMASAVDGGFSTSTTRLEPAAGMEPGATSTLTTSFQCFRGRDTMDLIVRLVAFADGCPLAAQDVPILCTNPDAGLPDAGAPPDGSVQQDAATADASAGDSGAVDAGADAGHEAGAVDGGHEGGAGNQWPSAECEACVEQKCSNVDESGFDLVTPCLKQNDSPGFVQLCSDAFFCSRNSSDGCALQPRGPVGCFCGHDVEVDDCQKGVVKGNCQAEWYAATGCSTGDHECVLRRFAELERPSGTANYLLSCEAKDCHQFSQACE